MKFDDYSVTEEEYRPPRKTAGFKLPSRDTEDTFPETAPDDYSFPAKAKSTAFGRKHRITQLPAIDLSSLPWQVIIKIALIVVVVGLCLIFKDFITETLNTFLQWTLTIAIIAFILWVIFHRRRR